MSSDARQPKADGRFGRMDKGRGGDMDRTEKIR